MGSLMIPLTTLYDKYIYRSKLSERKKKTVEYIVPPPPPSRGVGTIISSTYRIVQVLLISRTSFNRFMKSYEIRKTLSADISNSLIHFLKFLHSFKLLFSKWQWNGVFCFFLQTLFCKRSNDLVFLQYMTQRERIQKKKEKWFTFVTPCW